MTANRIDPSTIREAVRDRYGRIAQQVAQGTGCCASSTTCCEEACEVKITIKYRYLRDDRSALPETLRVLTEEQQRTLLSRICSADITTVKEP